MVRHAYLSWTMSLYLARRFLLTVLITFGIFLALSYMIDLVELTRRAASKEGLTFGLLASMALLHLPTLGAETLPFAMLLGGMAAFLRLTRSNELVVARAAGISAWQFLAPALCVALAIGIGMVTVYNPVAAAMSSRFDQLEALYLRGRPSMLAVSPNGLWLRQADEGGQSVIHALRVSEQGLRLDDVIILLYGRSDNFTGRIDARSASLEDGYWDMKNAWVTLVGDQPRHYDNYRQPTTLTLTEVQESFADPDTISFWDLPRFIDMAEAAGFSARRYWLHFYDILATPALLCTMVFLSAVFSLRSSRLGGLVQLVLGGVFSGFLLYFLTDLSMALGLSGILPPFLATWAPIIVAMFLGLAVLFHLEDG